MPKQSTISLQPFRDFIKDTDTQTIHFDIGNFNIKDPALFKDYGFQFLDRFVGPDGKGAMIGTSDNNQKIWVLYDHRDKIVFHIRNEYITHKNDFKTINDNFLHPILQKKYHELKNNMDTFQNAEQNFKLIDNEMTNNKKLIQFIKNKKTIQLQNRTNEVFELNVDEEKNGFKFFDRVDTPLGKARIVGVGKSRHGGEQLWVLVDNENGISYWGPMDGKVKLAQHDDNFVHPLLQQQLKNQQQLKEDYTPLASHHSEFSAIAKLRLLQLDARINKLPMPSLNAGALDALWDTYEKCHGKLSEATLLELAETFLQETTPTGLKRAETIYLFLSTKAMSPEISQRLAELKAINGAINGYSKAEKILADGEQNEKSWQKAKAWYEYENNKSCSSKEAKQRCQFTLYKNKLLYTLAESYSVAVNTLQSQQYKGTVLEKKHTTLKKLITEIHQATTMEELQKPIVNYYKNILDGALASSRICYCVGEGGWFLVAC